MLDWAEIFFASSLSNCDYQLSVRSIWCLLPCCVWVRPVSAADLSSSRMCGWWLCNLWEGVYANEEVLRCVRVVGFSLDVGGSVGPRTARSWAQWENYITCASLIVAMSSVCGPFAISGISKKNMKENLVTSDLVVPLLFQSSLLGPRTKLLFGCRAS